MKIKQCYGIRCSIENNQFEADLWNKFFKYFRGEIYTDLWDYLGLEIKSILRELFAWVEADRNEN